MSTDYVKFEAQRLLPLLKTKGPLGLTAPELQAEANLSEFIAREVRKEWLGSGVAFASFRPRNGRAGRVARVAVHMEFAGEGHGVPNTSDWVQS